MMWKSGHNTLLVHFGWQTKEKDKRNWGNRVLVFVN